MYESHWNYIPYFKLCIRSGIISFHQGGGYTIIDSGGEQVENPVLHKYIVVKTPRACM